MNDWAFELLGAALEDPSAGTSVESYGELLGARAERAILPLLGVDVVALARIAEEDPAGFGSVKGETYTGFAALARRRELLDVGPSKAPISFRPRLGPCVGPGARGR